MTRTRSIFKGMGGVAGISLILSLSIVPPQRAGAAVQTFEGAGANGAAIQSTVDAYRAALDAQTGEHLEIVWDAVPDANAAPNFLPADFFNAASGARARGVILDTPGQGVQVSADASNPTGTAVRFGNVNPTYANLFQAFSAERLFSPIGSNVVDLTFRVPGTDTPALVAGFGAVYTDADVSGVTSFEYFDRADQSLGVFNIPTADNGLSFLGALFDDPVVSRVQIVYGSTALGPDDGAGVDVAVMDNFIYDRPVPVASVPLPPAVLTAAATLPMLVFAVYRLRRNRR